MKTPKRSLIRIYATPLAVVAMGALWLWGDLGPMRGAILFCAGVIVVSILIGMRSERKTHRRIAEAERRLALLRTGGMEALREDLEREQRAHERQEAA